MGIPITFVTTNSWQIVFIIYSIMVSSSSVNHGMGREEWLAILEWHIAMIVSKTGGGTPYFTILYVTIQSWLYYVNSASSWMKRFLWVTHSGRREEWWNILFNGSLPKKEISASLPITVLLPTKKPLSYESILVPYLAQNLLDIPTWRFTLLTYQFLTGWGKAKQKEKVRRRNPWHKGRRLE